MKRCGAGEACRTVLLAQNDALFTLACPSKLRTVMSLLYV